jgi:hypothetical protein
MKFVGTRPAGRHGAAQPKKVVRSRPASHQVGLIRACRGGATRAPAPPPRCSAAHGAVRVRLAAPGCGPRPPDARVTSDDDAAMTVKARATGARGG